jgi:plasmid stabilization system protein ParE
MRRRYAVILMPHALDDLDALHAFIAQDSPETADEVYARLRTAILVLQDLPLRHTRATLPEAPHQGFRGGILPDLLCGFRISRIHHSSLAHIPEAATGHHGTRSATD